MWLPKKERERAIGMATRELRDRSRSAGRGERDALMERLSHDPSAFSRASKQMQDDKEVAMRAVALQASMLRWASSRLKADADVVMQAVQNSREKALHWHPLQLRDPSLRGNRDVALAALSCETQPSLGLSSIGSRAGRAGESRHGKRAACERMREVQKCGRGTILLLVFVQFEADKLQIEKCKDLIDLVTD